MLYRFNGFLRRFAAAISPRACRAQHLALDFAPSRPLKAKKGFHPIKQFFSAKASRDSQQMCCAVKPL
jgi:hypothetical protein